MKFIFISFSFLQVLTTLLIVFASNPIYAILLLILLFFETTVILFIFRLEFMSLLFILIYVGAIAVLFLFIVMMLKIKVKNIEILFFLPLIVSINSFIIILFHHLLAEPVSDVSDRMADCRK